MKTYAYLGAVGLAAASLFAAQASATTVCATAPATGTQTMGSPVCIAPSGTDGAGTGLQDQLNDMTSGGPGIDVYHDQTSASAYWTVGASGVSENNLMLEIAGNAGQNSFGIFDPTHPETAVQLFAGAANAGERTQLNFLGHGIYRANYMSEDGAYLGTSGKVTFGSQNLFGYYLSGPGGTFYSVPGLNSDGMRHMVALAGDGATKLNHAPFLANEYLLAWEDATATNSDRDYNDFVVMVESVKPVPEPAVLGLFGLGLLLIGGFTALRRQRDMSRQPAFASETD